jgi:hypothetical protein
MLSSGQPRIQGYPEILDRLRAVQGNSREKRFKETRMVHFPYKYEFSFLGIN